MMTAELKISYRYNRELLKYYSKSFYLSTNLLPKSKRNSVFALYGFCRYVDNLVDKPRHRTTEELTRELHSLDQELQMAYREGESEHPVLCSFIHTAKQFNIPIQYPQDLLKGVEMDINHRPFEDFDGLYVFCYRVAGVVGLMMNHILGYSDEKAFGYAEKLGIAMQLTNILRDVQEDKNNGRIYLPMRDLEKFNVSREEIINEEFTRGMEGLIKYYVEKAHLYYESAQPGISLLTPNCQFAIHSASTIYRAILDKIVENHYHPFKGRVFVTQAKKIRIILKYYLNGKFSLNGNPV